MSLQRSIRFRGHSNWVRKIAEIDAEDKIVTASWDGKVKLWSLVEKRCLRTFFHYDAEVSDIAVVNETTVLTVSDRKVELLSITDGCVLAVSNLFPDKLFSCAVLGTTTAVVADSSGKLFKIRWNSGDINITKQVTGCNEYRSYVKQIFARGNKFATCSSDNRVKLWDSTLSRIRVFRSNGPSVCCVAFDSVYLVMGSQDGLIRVFDVRTTHLLTTITTHTSWIRTVHLVPDANIVMSGDNHGVIAIHALPSGDCIAEYDIDTFITTTTLLSSGMLAVAGKDPYHVDVFNIALLRSLPIRHSLNETALIQKNTSDSYIMLLEARLTAALDRIENLEEAVISSSARISDLESSLKRLTLSREAGVEKCCVCIEPFRPGDNVFRLPCLHIHHTDCLLPFLQQDNEPKCPVCRTSVAADVIDNLPQWNWNPAAISNS